MHYKVTSQYAGARELPTEQYDDINKAKAYIENKLRENAALKLKVIYRLYEWDDLLQEFDPSKMDPAKLSSEGSDSDNQSQGQGKGSSFSPSPLPTSPRPPGMPASSFKRDDEKDKDKK